MRAKILILDDERAGIQHLRDALGAQHDVIWCRNIKSALAQLDAEQYDLIICGVHLLNESMFDFLRDVRLVASSRGVPFVCFRAVETKYGQSTDANIEAAAKMLGADKYLVVETGNGDAAALRREIESALAPFLERGPR